MKRVCFIGIGSIAQRHIKNLVDLWGEEIQIHCLHSTFRRGVSAGVSSNIVDLFSDNQLDSQYDAIFITNPTAAHYDSLKRLHNRSKAFFIEKPVFLSGNEDISEFRNTGKHYYVACPLRYTNVMIWIRNNIDFSMVHGVRAISSSYLPDWRSGVDYRDTYSAHKGMGGGVSVDLIHEWDYIIDLLGFPQRVCSIIGKKSQLEVDSDDIAVYIAEYQDKLVEIHLDYFGRKPIRRFELIMENDTIVADLIEQKIIWSLSGKVLNLAEKRDCYQKKELLHFWDIVNCKFPSDNTIENACRVLRIARGEI